jgi:hypothetical protein
VGVAAGGQDGLAGFEQVRLDQRGVGTGGGDVAEDHLAELPWALSCWAMARVSNGSVAERK